MKFNLPYNEVNYWYPNNKHRGWDLYALIKLTHLKPQEEFILGIDDIKWIHPTLPRPPIHYTETAYFLYSIIQKIMKNQFNKKIKQVDINILIQINSKKNLLKPTIIKTKTINLIDQYSVQVTNDLYKELMKYKFSKLENYNITVKIAVKIKDPIKEDRIYLNPLTNQIKNNENWTIDMNWTPEDCSEPLHKLLLKNTILLSEQPTILTPTSYTYETPIQSDEKIPKTEKIIEKYNALLKTLELILGLKNTKNSQIKYLACQLTLQNNPLQNQLKKKPYLLFSNNMTDSERKELLTRLPIKDFLLGKPLSLFEFKEQINKLKDRKNLLKLDPLSASLTIFIPKIKEQKKEKDKKC